MPGDELIGDVVEVVADNVRLRAYCQHIVADSLNLNQRRFPAGGDGADRIPGVTRDETELRGPDAELPFNVRRPQMQAYDALRCPHYSKEPREKVSDTSMLHLTRLYLNSVVRESE